VAVDQPEVVLDDAFAGGRVSAEPSCVPGRASRDTLKVRVGPVGVCLGTRRGSVDLRLSS